MTEITRAYEFVVFESDGTTPDLTFTNEDFAGDEPPTYGGWRVDPLEGSSESEPFTLSILDTSEQVTANLSDANGRADLIGRVWRLRINEDGGGLTVVAKGRVVGVQLNRSIAAYDFQCGDERYWTRSREIYRNIASPTTQFYPPGLRSRWQYLTQAAGTVEMLAEDVSDPDKVLFAITSGDPISERMIDWLRDDLLDDAVHDGTSGNFRYLRVNVGGGDREVISFSPSEAQAILSNIEEQEEHPVEINFVWVAWASHGLSPDTLHDGFMYAPNAPPSDVLPYHIGGDRGVDLLSELKDRYDDESVRYDSDAFDTWHVSTNPGGLLANPNIPDGHLRITAPVNLGDFEEALFKARLLAPFPNSAGEITPRFVTLPDTTNPSALTQVTSAKLRGADHPTFQQVGQQIKTVVVAKYQHARQLSRRAIEEDNDWPADLVTVFDYEEEYTNDRIDELGRHVHTVDMFGLWGSLAKLRADQLQRELFNRYGDGPIRGQFAGLSALDGVAAGDFVVINLSSYPDLATQTRGGLRLVQVMEVRHAPQGGEFEYVDAGADTNALAAPAVSIIKNTGRPKHDVDVTISSLPAGATYLVQLKVGSDNYRTFAQGTANETITIRNFPSGTLITPRVKAILIAQVGSAWATNTGVTLTSLTAPSGVTATATDLTVELTWTNGEADYRVMPTLDGADYLLAPLPAGTKKWIFVGLDATTLFTLGVKHVDEFGGESAITTDTDTTGTAGSVTGPRNFRLLQGFNALQYPAASLFGEGIEVSWEQNLGSHLRAVIEVANDVAFTVNKEVRRFDEGSRSARLFIPIDGVLKFVREKLEQLDGSAASPYSSGVRQCYAVPFRKGTPGPQDLRIAASLNVVPGMDGATPGFYIDLSYDLGEDTQYLFVDVRYTDGFIIIWQYAKALTGKGVHRIRNAGDTADFFFEDSFTAIQVASAAQIGSSATTPFDRGAASSFEVTDGSATGSGVRAELSSDASTPMSDFLVPGTNVTIDQDGDGRLRINATGGAGADLDDLADVTAPTPSDNDLLIFNTGTGQWENASQSTLVINISQLTGGPLGATLGGTGFASYSKGDILYADTTTSLAKATMGTPGQVLTSVDFGGGDIFPSWANPDQGVNEIAVGSGLSVANATGPTATVSLSFNSLSQVTPVATSEFVFVDVSTHKKTIAASIPADIFDTSGITTLGTITTGVWNATDVPLSAGGTGASLSDPGADRIMFWDDGVSTVDWLTATAGLEINGTNLRIASPLSEAYGGTGNSTWTQYDVVFAISANTLSGISVGSEDDVLTISTGVPTWTAPASGIGTIAATTGITITNGTGPTATVNLDLPALPSGIAPTGPSTFIFETAGTERRYAASALPLSIFDNNVGWTTNAGNITNVTAGTNLSGGGSSGSITLDVVASPSFTDVTFTSDMRLKELVTYIDGTSALDVVERMRPMLYRLKEDDGILRAGMSAQEIQAMLPHLVREDANGTLSLDYSRGVVTYLVAAVAELSRRLDEAA